MKLITSDAQKTVQAIDKQLNSDMVINLSLWSWTFKIIWDASFLFIIFYSDQHI